MTNTALEPISAVIPEVTNNNGKIVTTSIAVASYFHKRHDHVLDKIRSVMEDCEPSYRLPNFRETSYQRANPNGGDGISTTMYELTRDAFVLIVMGFTGKKALQWKIDYINAFNKMEAELQQSHNTLFPWDADLYVRIKEGKTVFVQQAQEGECFMSFSSFKDIAERAGYLVVHGDDLKSMTIDSILRLGRQASKSVGLHSQAHLSS